MRRFSQYFRRVCVLVLSLAMSQLSLGSTLGELPGAVRDSATKLLSSDVTNKLPILISLMASHGYFRTRIELAGDSIVIYPGRRSTLTNILFGGDTSFAYVVNAPYSDRLVAKITEEFVNGFQAKGYQYARTTIDSLLIRGDTVYVRCIIARGNLAILGEVQFDGLQRTSPTLVRRITGMESGDTVTSDLLTRLDARLAQLDFVRRDGEIELTPTNGFTAVDLLVPLTELPQLDLWGGIGYLPDEKSGLTWNGRGELRNLFGTAKSVRVDSRRPQKSRNELEIAFSMPTFVGGVGKWGLAVSTRDYLNQFYEFQIKSAWDVRSGSQSTIGATAGWRSVENELQSSFTAYSAGIRARLCDNSYQTISNRRWSIETEFTSVYRRMSADSTSNSSKSAFDTRARFDADLFHDFTGVLGARVAGGYRGIQTSDSLPAPSELFLIGGAPRLRGYRTDQFAAVHAITATIEPSILFPSGSTGMFVDAAWLSSRKLQNGHSQTDEEVHSGYGWFIRLTGERSNLSIALAWNPDVHFNEPRLTLELTSGL